MLDPQDLERIIQLKTAIAFFDDSLPGGEYNLRHVEAAIEGCEAVLKWLHAQRAIIQTEERVVYPLSGGVTLSLRPAPEGSI